jgi:hypothetical protein
MKVERYEGSVIPFVRRVIRSTCFYLDAPYHWGCHRRHYRYHCCLHREGNTPLVSACFKYVTLLMRPLVSSLFVVRMSILLSSFDRFLVRCWPLPVQKPLDYMGEWSFRSSSFSRVQRFL